jgi:ACS family sodium-dependent inorganic phosphate cotransporter
MAMAASSALQPDRCLLAALPRRRRLLRMLQPRAPPLSLLSHRRCLRGAARFSSGDGGGKGGTAGALEKRSVPVPEAAAEEEVAVDVDRGELELRWPPWEGLPERYRLMGATSLAFVICNMDKVRASLIAATSSLY